MLRSGQRNAARFHGALLAVYVRAAGLERRGPGSASMRTWRWPGNWAPRSTAQGRAIPSRRFWTSRASSASPSSSSATAAAAAASVQRSPLDRLIDATEDIDLRLFPHRSRR